MQGLRGGMQYPGRNMQCPDPGRIRHYSLRYRPQQNNETGEILFALMRTRLLLCGLIILLVGLQIRLWTGEGSYANLAELEQRIETQKVRNQVLKTRNQRLESQVRELKNGLDSVEETARNQLGLIKKGETFFLLVER